LVVLKRALFALSFALVGCNAPEPPPPSGGSDAGAGTCGRGIVVFDSDYHSTNVSLIGFDGTVLSPSFISSASAKTGLSAPLSGDVVAPTMPVTGDDVVLIDRYPAGVLTFVDAKSAMVRAQLDVKTGFASNPHDFAAIDSTKAYVLRYDPNLDPGHQPFDGGSDVLIVDPSVPKIAGRIDLTRALAGEKKGFYPRPERVVVVGNKAFVLLSGYSEDFQSAPESRVVTLDTERDAIDDVTVISGLHGCAGLALSPSKSALAVACSGTFQGSSTTDVAEAGLALLDLNHDLKEIAHASAEELGGDPFGFSVAFIDEHTVLATTFGRQGGPMPKGDRAVVVDLDDGSHHDVLSTKNAFTLGEVRCALDCKACFVSDAEESASLVRFDLANGALSNERTISPDPEVGLPARYIGTF
jgi:hypothetical protein